VLQPHSSDCHPYLVSCINEHCQKLFEHQKSKFCFYRISLYCKVTQLVRSNHVKCPLAMLWSLTGWLQHSTCYNSDPYVCTSVFLCQSSTSILGTPDRMRESSFGVNTWRHLWGMTYQERSSKVCEEKKYDLASFPGLPWPPVQQQS